MNYNLTLDMRSTLKSKDYSCVLQCSKKFVCILFLISTTFCKRYFWRCSIAISLHKFPKNKLTAAEWVVQLKIGKDITKYDVVCSEHFEEIDFKSTFVHLNIQLIRSSVHFVQYGDCLMGNSFLGGRAGYFSISGPLKWHILGNDEASDTSEATLLPFFHVQASSVGPHLSITSSSGNL